ncbi:MAG: OmpH family outer membrane protein [Gammaproteobacteria bacterium]
MKKSAIILISICLFFVFGVGIAQAEKIAFVNTEKVVKKSPQSASILKALESEFKKRNDSLLNQRKKLKKLEDKLTKDQAIMSSSEAKNVQQDIRRLRRELNNSSAEFREDLNLRRSEEINKLLRKISEVVIAIGKSEKIDIILSSGVAYASDSVDISDKVLKKLEQDYNKGKK